jgi:hypothetical protein
VGKTHSARKARSTDVTVAPETQRSGTQTAIKRNWPGLLSIGLSVAGVALYFPVTALFVLCTAASLVVGIAAVVRARRGAGGLITSIVGLVLGGALTFLWVAWIVLFEVNPGSSLND